MPKEQDQQIIRTLSEKLTESLRGAIPESTKRRIVGRVSFPNKATAVIGMRRGHALETVVRIELERRRQQVTYVKTRDGFEVDFLARDASGHATLIQVAAEIADPATRQREMRALLAAKAEHPAASLQLVTLTPELAVDAPEEIEIHPAWRWLLTESAPEEE